MDPASLENLATIGGAAVATTIVCEVLFRTLGAGFDKARFGALFAVVVGVVLTEIATIGLGLGTMSDFIGAAFAGLFAGASSIGIHDVVTDTTSTP